MFYQILNVKTDIDLCVIQFSNFMYPLKIFVKVVVYEIFKVFEHLLALMLMEFIGHRFHFPEKRPTKKILYSNLG